MQTGTRLAAVDLGSNSFRLEIGVLDHGQIQRTDYLKETVRQGGGLDENRQLSAAAMQRGWDCLARFGERLAGFEASQVRAVATQTLREARNREAFLERAAAILGFPIEVISGKEEARLIYQGVAHLLPQSDERRLVIDIGGRSTELILGQGYQAGFMDSFRVGSVAWSMRYFPAGRFTPEAFDQARIAAQAVLDEALEHCGHDGWDIAYGSSGTVGAVADILQAGGWPAHKITRAGLAWLHERLLKGRSAGEVRLDGLKEDRRPVIGGGVSVLLALFELLAVEELHVAQGALRHGALYDLLEREHLHGDQRSASVNRLARNLKVDAAQAQRVAHTAGLFYEQLAAELPIAQPGRDHRKLQWAAQLHEIGRVISHSDYHKHGAYILDNADAAGFTMPELHRLSLLVLGHRGKLRKLPVDFEDREFLVQLLALRLAVILCHARRDPEIAGLRLACLAPQHTFELSHPADWERLYPQTAHLLREESTAWQKTPWALRLAVSH